MKRKWTLALFALLSLSIPCVLADAAQSERITELVQLTAYDGYTLEGKLDLPASGSADKLVVFVNGSGPNTYDNRRTTGDAEFCYFDLFAEQLTQRGIAFFRMNTRGVTPADTPPMYCEIDETAYQTYLPSNTVRDVETAIASLSTDGRLTGARVFLLGWSEGTVIAPLVAQRGNVKIDALLLAGYMNDRMEDVLTWQQTGGSSMVFYRQYFNTDGDDSISPAEFEADPYGIVPALDVGFADLDADADDALTANDFFLMLEPSRTALFDAIQRGDDDWLRDNYSVRLTSAWFRDHHTLAPNSETLPTLDLPIHIFHGVYDGNTRIEGVYAIHDRFEALGKDNLTVHIYPDADHDLNYAQYVYNEQLPQGFNDLFDTCNTL